MTTVNPKAREAVGEALQTCVRCGEVDVVLQSKVDGVDDLIFARMQSAVRNMKSVRDVPWGPSSQPPNGTREKEEGIDVTAAADL